MVENGSNWHIGALPPEETHPEFLALCALATSGTLNAQDYLRLGEHLSRCAGCRQVMAQYEAILGKVVPALTLENDEALGTDNSPTWSLDDAEVSLFARLDEEVSYSKRGTSVDFENDPSLDIDSSASSDDVGGEALWHHLWWQFAAGVALFARARFWPLPSRNLPRHRGLRAIRARSTATSGAHGGTFAGQRVISFGSPLRRFRPERRAYPGAARRS